MLIRGRYGDVELANPEPPYSCANTRLHGAPPWIPVSSRPARARPPQGPRPLMPSRYNSSAPRGSVEAARKRCNRTPRGAAAAVRGAHTPRSGDAQPLI